LQAILGIGNPGAKYVNTKHNAGFIIIDRFVDKYDLDYLASKNDYLYAEGKILESDFIIIRPTTYVNNSGLAAKDVLDKYDIPLQNFLTVVDDINLSTGQLRLRKSGGTGGHNGLESIIYHLISDEFPRLRFGIGADFEDGFQADYVLSKFSKNELDNLDSNFNFAVELLEKFIVGGLKEMTDHFSKFSNIFNQKNPPHEREEN
jgi:PTH1 family peptidyl-tRNA hydrolase